MRETGSDLQGTSKGKATYKYKVSGDWAKKLFQEYKLDVPIFEEYLYLCRDKLAANKRNLDLYVSWKRERDLEDTIDARTKRIKNNPDLYTPFARVPEAEQWLAEFSRDAMRYPVLLVHAPSHAGKSEWAVSLFRKPLYVEIGASCMWQFLFLLGTFGPLRGAFLGQRPGLLDLWASLAMPGQPGHAGPARPCRASPAMPGQPGHAGPCLAMPDHARPCRAMPSHAGPAQPCLAKPSPGSPGTWP